MEKAMEKPVENLFCGMVSLRALIDGARGEKPKRKIERVLYSAERREKYPKEYAYLTHRAEEGLFELTIAEKAQIDALTGSGTHGGIAAFCGQRTYPALRAEDLAGKGFFVMTEGVEDPYNFGYMLRSLYAAGVEGVVLVGGVRTGADGIVCRSSAGASERMEIYLDKSEKVLPLFKEAGYKIVCADMPDSVPVYDADLKKPLLLVVGGERRGITRQVLAQSDAIVRLCYGRDFGEALSAASAAAVLAFEVLRQNR